MTHKATSPDAYIGATVTTSDITRSAKFTRPEAAALLPFDAGYIYIASMRNASEVSCRVPKLYRANGKASKRIDRRKRLNMLDPRVAGRKAAMYASAADNIEEVTDQEVEEYCVVVAQANYSSEHHRLLEVFPTLSNPRLTLKISSSKSISAAT